MVGKVGPKHLDERSEGHHHQRYFKLTRKGRVPKVTKVWPSEEKTRYTMYLSDIILLLLAAPIAVARTTVSDGTWVAENLEMALIIVLFFWLMTMSSDRHKRLPPK
jgi:hypothetical protein